MTRLHGRVPRIWWYQWSVQPRWSHAPQRCAGEMLVVLGLCHEALDIGSLVPVVDDCDQAIAIALDVEDRVRIGKVSGGSTSRTAWISLHGISTSM